jgi:hypothetical protein
MNENVMSQLDADWSMRARRRRALLKPLVPSIFPSPYMGDSNMRGGLPQGRKMDDGRSKMDEV